MILSKYTITRMRKQQARLSLRVDNISNPGPSTRRDCNQNAPSDIAGESALKCTRFGAQQGIPGYEEVLEFMKTHEGVVYDG